MRKGDLPGFLGHFWHLLKPQEVPTVPQQSSFFERPGSALPHCSEEVWNRKVNWVQDPLRESTAVSYSHIIKPFPPYPHTDKEKNMIIKLWSKIAGQDQYNTDMKSKIPSKRTSAFIKSYENWSLLRPVYKNCSLRHPPTQQSHNLKDQYMLFFRAGVWTQDLTPMPGKCPTPELYPQASIHTLNLGSSCLFKSLL